MQRAMPGKPEERSTVEPEGCRGGVFRAELCSWRKEKAGLERTLQFKVWIKQDLSVVLQCCEDPAMIHCNKKNVWNWEDGPVGHATCHASLRTRVQIPATMEIPACMRQREDILGIK